MKKFLLFICCILTLRGFSQDDLIYLKGQKALNWFHSKLSEMQRKMPSTASIANAQPNPIPANMMEILKQYDWVKLGNYWFKDGDFSSETKYGRQTNQIRFDRYTQNGIQYGLECRKDFQKNTAQFMDTYSGKNAKITIEKINGRNFLKFDYANVNGEKASYGQIISYNNGILIYDVSREGTVAAINSRSRFRGVYMAVPRMNIGNTLHGVNSPYLRSDEDPNPKYPSVVAGSSSVSKSTSTSVSASTSKCNPMSSTQFQQVFDTVKQATFDKDRLTKAKSVLGNGKCFSVNQVSQMMELFPFSTSKMKFLEMVYPHTSNKQSFGSLASKLTFSRDKEKLKEIIRNGGN